MLESLEQSNIKRMSLEGPEEQREIFDLDTEFTEHDWHEMGKVMAGPSEFDAAMISSMAANLRVLKPNMDLRAYLSDADLAKWQAQFDRLKNDPHPGAGRMALFISANAHVAFGYPHFCELKMEDWPSVNESMEAYRRNKEWYPFIQMALGWKQLGGEMLFPATEKAEIEEHVKALVKHSEVNISSLERTKELFPEMDLEIPPEKYQMIWDAMRHQKKHNNWPEVVTFARFLNLFKSTAILKLDKDRDAIPEQRNF